ncbi:MAG: type II toxin-antitoxin system VapB family antitoxin [Chloroflexota bacterium]|nr:type II toxin-antitoxin system VapB family antitoxin [Chloroflexota bacterium]
MTGESAETIVQVAVREQLALLDEVEAEVQRRAEVYALVKSRQASFKEHPEAAVDHGELLYGEDGLPR